MGTRGNLKQYHGLAVQIGLEDCSKASTFWHVLQDPDPPALHDFCVSSAKTLVYRVS